MAFTRLGYLLILAIMLAGAVAIALVVRDFGGDSGSKKAAAPPEIEFQRVIDFLKYGAITSIDVNGKNLTVHFRDDVDTSGLDASSPHTFHSTVPDGRDAVRDIEAAGIRVNTPDGLPVVVH